MINLKRKFRKLREINNEGIVKIFTADNLFAVKSIAEAVELTKKQLAEKRQTKWNNGYIELLFKRATELNKIFDEFTPDRFLRIKKMRSEGKSTKEIYQNKILEIRKTISIKNDKARQNFSIGALLDEIEKSNRRYPEPVYIMIMDIRSIYRQLEEFVEIEDSIFERIWKKNKKLFITLLITILIFALFYAAMYMNVIQIRHIKFKIPKLNIGVDFEMLVKLILVFLGGVSAIISLLKLRLEKKYLKRNFPEGVEKWQKLFENIKVVQENI